MESFIFLKVYIFEELLIVIASHYIYIYIYILYFIYIYIADTAIKSSLLNVVLYFGFTIPSKKWVKKKKKIITF